MKEYIISGQDPASAAGISSVKLCRRPTMY